VAGGMNFRVHFRPAQSNRGSAGTVTRRASAATTPVRAAFTGRCLLLEDFLIFGPRWSMLASTPQARGGLGDSWDGWLARPLRGALPAHGARLAHGERGSGESRPDHLLVIRPNEGNDAWQRRKETQNPVN
jgi:hypothetical protein